MTVRQRALCNKRSCSFQRRMSSRNGSMDMSNCRNGKHKPMGVGWKGARNQCVVGWE